MTSPYSIPSSDPALLEKAVRLAREFADQYTHPGIVGIVFLGAIPRGYFDLSADIDIALFKEQDSEISLPSQFLDVEGMMIHCHLADYASELAASWDMPKRWTFSQGRIDYDPTGRVARLLAEKIPLKPEEKKWLLMSGLCLSEWYVNDLTGLWVQRGNITSAHHMVARGLDYFFDMLFAWNDQLVPDTKWKYYCAEKLPRLPDHFQENVQAAMLLHEFSVEELERRKGAFMPMWQEMRPIIEREVHMPYNEIVNLV